MSANKITKEALGRLADLGHLYNARKDCFCSSSVFTQPIPDDFKITVPFDNSFEKIQQLESNKISETFTTLVNEPDLQLSVLAGFVPLSGSAKFLKKFLSDPSYQSLHSLVFRMKTKHEKAVLPNQYLNEEMLMKGINQDATHIVVGVFWGANSIFSFQCKEGDLEKITDAATYISKVLDLSDSTANEKITNMCGNVSNYKIKYHLDVLPDNEEPPNKIEEILPFLCKLKAFVENDNAVPLVYEIMPISEYLEYRKCSVPLHIAKHISTADTNHSLNRRFVDFFSEVYLAEQQMHNIYEEGKLLRCLDNKALEAVASNKYKFEIYKTTLISRFQNKLVEVRSGETAMVELEQLLRSFTTNCESSPDKIFELIETESWNAIKKKIQFVKTIRQNGAKYIGWHDCIQNELQSCKNKKCIVFYFSENGKLSHIDKWFHCKNIFMKKLAEENTLHKYFAIDCDIHTEEQPENYYVPCVKQLQSGEIPEVDLLQEDKQFQVLPMAYAEYNSIPNIPLPHRHTSFAIPCIGQTCSSSAVHEWVCPDCRKAFVYGFDQFVYCTCGKSPVASLQFKCTDSAHGSAFLKHDSDKLQKHLNMLQPQKQINILLLGETGVGKSTWINSFIHFVNYKSLEEAEAGELYSLISSKVTYFDRNYEEIEVITKTSDDNESFIQGQSATQQARMYPIPYGDVIYNLIDTPGIGDTRGTDQDKKNLESILSALSFHDEIHGICILLQPNISRLTLTFRFCIKELLTYLHRDASKNIMFCFTNCRGTSYRPGETLPALKKLLSEINQVKIEVKHETVYCFDSEAYRFLTASKHNPPIQFTYEDKLNFKTSWTNSREETLRMIQHICNLQPHPVQSTINLNYSRELVLKLTRPLAELCRTIEMNKSAVEKEIEDIRETKKSIGELRKKQILTRTEIQPQKLDFPKTVCGNPDCIKYTEVNEVPSIEYITVCHNPCSIIGVNSDSIGSFLLMTCKNIKFATGLCKRCGHSYKDHHHLFYESILVSKSFEDASVTEELNQCKNIEEVKRKLIEAKYREIEEYKEELRQIQEASLSFAKFLSTNAITVYNDAMEQYLNHLILEEEGKLQAGKGDKGTLDNLRKHKATYEEKMRHLLAGVGQGEHKRSDFYNPNEIQNKITQLQNLKHSGKYLLDVQECLRHTKHSVKGSMYERAKIYIANFYKNKKPGKKNKIIDVIEQAEDALRHHELNPKNTFEG